MNDNKLELSQDLHLGAFASQVIENKLAACASLRVHTSGDRNNIGVCLIVGQVCVLHRHIT